LEQSAHAHVMGIRLQPTGAAAFAPFKLSEIQNEVITLESLWGAAGRSLQDAVISAGSDEDRTRVFENFLLHRLATQNPDRRIEAAVRLIEQKQGRITVTEMSEYVGYGPRQLERQFLWKIGLGPKAFARTIRLQTVLQLVPSGLGPDWARLALESGFSDQAHLIREFKRFSGEPPEMFLQRDYALYEFFSRSGEMSDLFNTQDVSPQ
jgi:AraC-like DNA-binding protein